MESKLQDELLGAVATLPAVNLQASRAYADSADALVAFVDKHFADHPDLERFIGGNPLSVLQDNHRNHCRLMTNVFLLSNYGLLARIIPWVYRSYTARGFDLSYFPEAFRTWIAAVEEVLAPENRESIIAIYRWLKSIHEKVATRTDIPSSAEVPIELALLTRQREFFNLLLTMDGNAVARTVNEWNIAEPKDIEEFYHYIIQPTMYAIGTMWERGEITVAEEHLYTAITSRIMAGLYPVVMAREPMCGRALVTCSPNEHHEIGARMVADLLQLDGWDVTYLGANTPVSDLVSLARKQSPRFVALSIAMPFNFVLTRETIQALREIPSLSRCRIMVGGRALAVAPDIAADLGADAWAWTARDAVSYARKLCDESKI